MAKLAQPHCRLGWVAHDAAFSYLEFELGGLESGPCQDLRHLLGQKVAVELPRRQVDAHLDGVALVTPRSRIPAGDFQRPVPHAVNQADVLRDGDELQRRDKAHRRVAPSHERFYSRYKPGSQIELGLVHEEQFVSLQSARKTTLQR